jgi:2-keto-3-deoxy-L-rhamnonate aldolase RhmA
MYKKNRIKEMIVNGQIPLGMQCFTGDPALIEIMGLTGFDYVMLDSEHSGSDPRAMETLIRAADSVGLTSFVRVPQATDEASIHRALEAGAMGVYLPEIESVEDVEKAAEAAFYYPKGNRGICPSVRAAHYNPDTFVDYAAWNNNEIMLVPMIENPSALADLENIFAHPDVHMAVFAEGDYGFSVGEGMDLLTGTKVKEAYQQVLAAGAKHNVAVIGGPVLAADPDSCRQAIEAGVRVFSIGLDAVVFRSACQAMADALDKGTQGTKFSRPQKKNWGFAPLPNPQAFSAGKGGPSL